MPDQLQLRGGTTAEHSTFTGAIKEVTVDTTKKTAVVHDGIAPGGFPLLRQDGSNSALALGSLGTPSLKWDANTGIYSPGEDELAVVTNGTRRLLLTGNSFLVGAPDANACNLQIGDGATGDRDVFIDLVGDTTYSDYGARFNRSAGPNGITYFAHRGTGAFSILTQEAGPITFSTTNTERLRLSGTGDFVFRGAGTTPGTDKAVFFSNAAPVNSMVLDSSGRLGIGTSLPDTTLHIESTLNRVIRASSSDTGATNSLLINNGSNYHYGVLGNVSGTNLIGGDVYGLGYTAAAGADFTPVLSWTANTGRVGIGTTNPSYKLHVVATSSAAARFVVDNDAAGISALAITNDANADFETIIYTSKASIGSSVNIPICFHTNGKANEKMRLDTSGRLLVGTTSTSSTATIIAQGSNGGAAAPGIFRACHKTTPANDELFAYYLFGDSTHCDAAYIAAARDGGTWTSGTSHPTRLVFSTTPDSGSSPTERMRITQSGAILLGCTSAPNPGSASTSSGFAINGTNNDAYITHKQDNAPLGYLRRDGTDGSIYDFKKGNSTVGSISVTASATAFNTSSDYRLKENVIAVTDGITRLQQLNPSRFNFIADPAKTVDGFIAHEVQDVVPEAIHGTKDEVDADGNPVYQGIDQSKLVPLLTAALQEAIAKIETLEQRLTAAGID